MRTFLVQLKCNKCGEAGKDSRLEVPPDALNNDGMKRFLSQLFIEIGWTETAQGDLCAACTDDYDDEE